MNKFLTKIVGAALGLTLAIGVGVAVGVNQGESREVEATVSTMTFTPSSKTSGTLTNGAAGVSATYNNTYATNQITKNNSASLTFSVTGSYQYEIKGITLSLKNNASSGAGTVTAKIGSTSIASNLSATGYGSTYGDKTMSLTAASTSNYLDSTNNFVINISCSTNSVYVQNYKISYEAVVTGPAVRFESTISYLKMVEDYVTKTATIQNPAGTEGPIVYESSNTDVATINSSGKITATGVGTTTISASATGAESDSFDLKVLSAHNGESEENALSVIEASNFYNNLTGAEKTGPYYIKGTVTSIDTSGEYDDYYLDNSEFSFYGPEADTGIDLSEIAVGSVVTAYGELSATSGGDVYSGGPVVVSIVNPTLDHISVTGDLSTATYKNTETEWDVSGLVVKAHYTDDSETVITGSVESWSYSVASPFDVDLNGADSKEVTVRFTALFNEMTAYIDKTVNITKNNLTSLSFSGGTQKSSFAVGDKFGLGAGIALRANRTSGYLALSLDNPNVVVKLNGSAINVSTYTFTLSDNGKTIDIAYTEHGITKALSDASPSKAYSITVAYIYTAESTIATIATNNKWTNDTEYPSFALDSVVTITTTSTSTKGKYFSSDSTYRIYQNGSTDASTSLTVGLPNYGFNLQSIKFTFTTAKNGKFMNPSGEQMSSNDVVEVTGKSATFTIGGTGESGNKYNGQVKITAIEVKYSLDDFGAWCNSVINDLTCNNGVTAPSTVMWSTLSTNFGKLDSAIRTYAVTLAANESGNITQQAMAKYDYIVGKYNKHLGLTSEYPDFITRDPEEILGLNNIAATTPTNNILSIVVVVVTTISLVAVSGYFVIRRRREN